MKRVGVALAIGLVLVTGAMAPASADPPDRAAAVVVHRCVDGYGEGSTTVRGEVKAKYRVPAGGPHGLEPCL